MVLLASELRGRRTVTHRGRTSTGSTNDNHALVQFVDGPARRVREQKRQNRMDEAGRTGGDHARGEPTRIHEVFEVSLTDG